MSTTEDTSAIDEKKTSDSSSTSQNLQSNLVKFLSNYITSLVVTIGISVVLIGSLGLYTTKVVQSNILPDNINLAPFTDINRVVSPLPVDINIIRDAKTVSQKAIFDSEKYLESFKKSLLCSLKNNASPMNGLFSNGPLFFTKVYDGLISQNNAAINAIFLYLGYLPESLIMLVYGFFGIFIWFGLYFFNFFISIFYHIINIPNLFRDTLEKDETTWEAESDISFFRLTKLVIFFFLWIPVGIFSAIFMPILTTLTSLISPLTAKYRIDGNNRELGVLDFIRDTIVYKKCFIFILASLSLISNAYKYLGASSLIGVFVAIIIAYFMGLYKQELPETNNVTGFSQGLKNQEIKQAKVSFDNSNKINICKKVKELKKGGDVGLEMSGGGRKNKNTVFNIKFF